jgi:hypothetical protein
LTRSYKYDILIFVNTGKEGFMPTIHIDEQVMAELKQRAIDKTPNDVIRQLLDLTQPEAQSPQPGVYLIPHSPKEFYDVDALKKWLSGELSKNGKYSVASSHYWANVIPDSICLFHKNKTIVGEGKMIGRLMVYIGNEVSPDTGIRYAGEVHFEPASINVYAKPIPFKEVEKLLCKKLTFRGIQKLTQKDYAIIHKAYPI